VTAGVRANTARARASLAAAAIRFEAAAATLVKSGIEMAEADAKSTTLFRDGPEAETRGSITGQLVGPYEGFVLAEGAARFLENGTRPHWIGASVQVRPGVWRWIGMHPGTAARPFMHQARDRVEQRLAAHAAQIVDNALR
jgi:hypothetical protein